MYFVTKEILDQLPDEAKTLIQKEGITPQEMDAMTPEERDQLMSANENDVQMPDMEEAKVDPGEMSEMKSDEAKLPKPTEYGDENQFRDTLADNGEMKELPESKKNAISSFEDAHARGNALIDELSKPKKKKEITQEELEK